MSNPTSHAYRFPTLDLSGGWTVVTWRSRQASAWVTQLKDADDNQIGDAFYDGHVDGVETSRRAAVERFKNTPHGAPPLAGRMEIPEGSCIYEGRLDKCVFLEHS